MKTLHKKQLTTRPSSKKVNTLCSMKQTIALTFQFPGSTRNIKFLFKRVYIDIFSLAIPYAMKINSDFNYHGTLTILAIAKLNFT